MLNWFRSRARSVPVESRARLGREMPLEDRSVPCSGHDMMASAAMVAATAAAPPIVSQAETDAEPTAVQATGAPATFAPPATEPAGEVATPAVLTAPVAFPPDNTPNADEEPATTQPPVVVRAADETRETI